MKVVVDQARKVLVIEVPMQEPTPSKTGKMLLIGGTEGWTGTGVKLANGSEIRLNLTAGIRNPQQPVAA